MIRPLTAYHEPGLPCGHAGHLPSLDGIHLLHSLIGHLLGLVGPYFPEPESNPRVSPRRLRGNKARLEIAYPILVFLGSAPLPALLAGGVEGQSGAAWCTSDLEPCDSR